MTYSVAATRLAGQTDPRMRAVGLWALTRCVSTDKLMVIPGETITVDKQRLFVEAIRCDPTFAPAVSMLGCTLAPGHTVQLADGRRMTQMDLFLEALRINPTYAAAYTNLGNAVPAGSRAVLPDGRELTARELYIEAIAHDAEHANAYNNLGNVLGTGETVALAGRTFTQRELYAEALRLDPANRDAAHNLAVLTAAMPAPAPAGGAVQPDECCSSSSDVTPVGWIAACRRAVAGVAGRVLAAVATGVRQLQQRGEAACMDPLETLAEHDTAAVGT